MKNHEPETILVNCPNCATPVRMHAPMMVSTARPEFSQVMLLPSWSMNERICKNCSAMLVPAIQNVNVRWTHAMPKEDKRIVIPNMAAVPKDLQRVG